MRQNIIFVSKGVPDVPKCGGITASVKKRKQFT
jgi:hypothetical protein